MPTTNNPTKCPFCYSSQIKFERCNVIETEGDMENGARYVCIDCKKCFWVFVPNDDPRAQA